MLSTSSQGEDDTSDLEVVDLEQEMSLSPFDMIGSWDKETLANVSMTVSGFMDNSNPEYPVRFFQGSFSSYSIIFDNVQIPYSSEKGYGHNYIFICLPDVIEKFIKLNAPKQLGNLVGSKYLGKPGEWWKPAYNIEGVFKVADKNQIRTPVSLEKILNHSKMGVQANLRVTFLIMRKNCYMENIINIEILFGLITSVGGDIKIPTLLGTFPGQLRPHDITSDDILKNLEEFRDVPC